MMFILRPNASVIHLSNSSESYQHIHTTITTISSSVSQRGYIEILVDGPPRDDISEHSGDTTERIGIGVSNFN